MIIIGIYLYSTSKQITPVPENQNLPKTPPSPPPLPNDIPTEKEADQQNHWENAYSFPYPVSWQGKGWGEPNFSLTKVELDETSSGMTLTLHFDIQTKYEGFCASTLAVRGLRRISDELGNLVNPRLMELANPKHCVTSNSTLFDQKIFFDNIPLADKEIIIAVFGQNGEQQTFFTVKVQNNGTLDVQIAPSQG